MARELQRLVLDAVDIEIRTDPPGTHGSFVLVSEAFDSPMWQKNAVLLEAARRWSTSSPRTRPWPGMRARVTNISVDSSQHAVSIERLLERALSRDTP
ncbi:hypothetical protein [Streptomyces longwoodensis]|uniref:hypothetical protein n=1 Tax=Streptomyces longwoodensis TaxID=68231 RepID=UPI0038242724